MEEAERNGEARGKNRIEYTGALKAPVRCFGNHLSGKGKSSFQTDNECGGAAILKNRTSRMEDASWLLTIIRSAPDPTRILLS